MATYIQRYVQRTVRAAVMGGKSTRSTKARSSVSVLGRAILGMLRKARSRGLTVQDVDRVMDRADYVYEMFYDNGEAAPNALRLVYNRLPQLRIAIQKQDTVAALQVISALEPLGKRLASMP